MARGPFAWRNAAAMRAGTPASERVEATLYGDQLIEGEVSGELGPYDLLNAFDLGEHVPRQVLVLRATIHAAREVDQVDPKPRTVEDLKTDYSTFHGGDMSDEIAAVVALALGARCKSGGTTRNWFMGTDLDGPGHPTGFGHRRPVLPQPSRRGAQLPFFGRRVSVSTATDLLQRYLALAPDAATALMRAARLYQQAVWIADDDPSQAWLWLVSALEVAAEQWRGSAGKRSEILRENWPELSTLALRHGVDFHDEVATVAASLFKAQHRFVSFVLTFLPPPPVERPHEWAQVEWAPMDSHLRKIYGYRSRALHAGVPFPVPMCETPREFDDLRPIERPIGLATKALDGEWIASDVPMLLWVFEYIARQTLLAWWRQLP